MGNIIKGTTPTILYKFSQVDVADITAAYITVKNGDGSVIEKDMTTAIIGDDSIAWRFTQQETLSFCGDISVMLNWILSDGTRGASRKVNIEIRPNYKEVVI